MIKEEITSIRVNQTNTHFSIATTTGYQIFSLNPIKLCSKKILKGGLSIVEMLERTQFVGIVGGTEKPFLGPNVFALYDDSKSEIFHQIEMKNPIKNIKISMDL